MKNLVIYNKHAAKGFSANGAEKILEMLKGAGIDADLRETEYPNHAAELAEEAAKQGSERVFICGGDGSINEAFNGLVAAQKAGLKAPALGVIPNGRGNDYVTGLQLPRKLDAMQAMFREDKRTLVDVGYAGDGTFERCFANGSGFGVDSAVNYHATQCIFNGKISYLWGVVEAIFHDMLHQEAHFTVDGKEFDMKMVLFTAMNGLQEGGGFKLAPEFSVTDGLLDICVVGMGYPALKLISLIPRLALGRMDSPDIFTMKAHDVHVHLDADKRGLYSQIDGETIIVDGRDFYVGISPYKVELITNGL